MGAVGGTVRGKLHRMKMPILRKLTPLLTRRPLNLAVVMKGRALLSERHAEEVYRPFQGRDLRPTKHR
ncbi:hypothetical protein CCS41_14515 (plasmid) [Candidatus Fukatsuia symbiotica]|uniref:Uncharacterized protein n=1 Tax=Candidatus Fukatsuia symbiotica TaxID=1878942 RepID=A0A2U8IB95_9GAMM|nr:hypothetical protein CCS41_14515 [Candidatus Fukatsuia symbiotica]